MLLPGAHPISPTLRMHVSYSPTLRTRRQRYQVAGRLPGGPSLTGSRVLRHSVLSVAGMGRTSRNRSQALLSGDLHPSGKECPVNKHGLFQLLINAMERNAAGWEGLSDAAMVIRANRQSSRTRRWLSRTERALAMSGEHDPGHVPARRRS